MAPMPDQLAYLDQLVSGVGAEVDILTSAVGNVCRNQDPSQVVADFTTYTARKYDRTDLAAMLSVALVRLAQLDPDPKVGT